MYNRFCAFVAALAIGINSFGQSINVRDSLLRTAFACYEQEQYDEAIVLFKQSLNSFLENNNKKDTHDIAGLYFKIGECYYQVDSLDNALVSYQKALIHYQESKDSLSLAKCYYNIGEINFDQDDYLDGFEKLQTSASILKQSGNTNIVEYGNALNLSGGCLYSLGDYYEAISFFEQAIEVFIRTAGDISYQHANSLNGMGNSYVAIGELKRGFECLNKALYIRGKVFGLESNKYATSLYGIADYYQFIGDYEKAIDCYKKTANIIVKNEGEFHPYYAFSMFGIGQCYSEISQQEKALQYYKAAENLIKEIFGPENYRNAVLFMNIADSYYQQGEIYNALNLYQKADSLYSKYPEIYPQEHAWPIEGIGECYGALADYENAIQYYKLSMTIRENNLGDNHPDYACSLYGLGICYAQIKQYDKAIELLKRAKDIRSRYLMETNPDYISCHKALADIYYVQDMLPELAKEVLISSRLTKKLILESFLYLTTGERENIWKAHSGFFFNRMPKYALKLREYPEVIEELYDDMLFCKGLLLNTSIELKNLIAENGDEESISLYERIQEKQVLLNRLSDKSSKELANHEVIAQLKESIDSLESKLLKKSKAFGDYTTNLSVTWNDVIRQLKRNEIAIEFIEVPISTDTTLYCSLSLKKHNHSPVFTPLFFNYELHSLQQKVIADTGEDYKGRTRIHHFNESGYLCRHKTYDGIIYTYPELYKTVWGNLQNEINNCKNIYFSPSGELYQLAIEYLYNGKHYINETKNYFRLSSTKQILNAQNYKTLHSAVLFGGINYNASEETVSFYSDNNHNAAKNDNDELVIPSYVSRGGGDYFPDLSGTKIEVQAIGDLLDKHSIENRLYIGDKGTESAFKLSDAAPHDLIHVATHGFFWHDQEASHYSEILGWSSLMPLNNGSLSKEDIEMTRTGLAFSGANNVFKGGAKQQLGIDDGILTAKEISTIDFRGANMVVLSACQTGLGDVSGEGVMGLQRGFKKAGAQTIIMSLWEVNDDATRLLMQEFYNQITKGKTTRQALSIAQKKIRKIPEYNCPYYWGAFIVLD